MSAIRAVTFDLWDTLVYNDSDEPKRRHLLWQALNEIEPLDCDRIRLASDVADAGFRLTWKEASTTWRLEQRVRVILAGLGRSLPQATFDSIIERMAAMEVEIAPDPIPGAGPALAELARRYRLAIVSDAIVTPGTGLRQLLEHHGLRQHFGALAFSDEVGRSKPHRSMFAAAARALDVRIEETVHVGDRDHNDVKGPQALGARAVLFTAARATDRETTSADSICNDHRDLPAIIDRLAAG